MGEGIKCPWCGHKESLKKNKGTGTKTGLNPCANGPKRDDLGRLRFRKVYSRWPTLLR
jgi:DNA-directed RNA polymerase subunit RPC12/RpoP